MGSKQKTKIVFFDVCGRATKFTSQELAEEAAEVYGRNAGYRCEAFQCDKCISERHGNVYHVRGVVRRISPTGDPGPQFQSSTVSVSQLDRALGTKEEIAALLEGIPE